MVGIETRTASASDPATSIVYQTVWATDSMTHGTKQTPCLPKLHGRSKPEAFRSTPRLSSP